MDLQEYWIGDLVKLKRSGRVGTFAGVKENGKACVRIGKKIVVTTPNNLFPLPEDDMNSHFNHLLEDIEKENYVAAGKKSRRDFPPEIDLHIENLWPELANEAPQIILNYQLRRCKAYIEEAIALNKSRVVVIHGKGKGRLRGEVEHLLQQYDEIAGTSRIHLGGATEVVFM